MPANPDAGGGGDYTYPRTIENGGGERLTFVRRVRDPDGESLEVENLVKPGAGSRTPSAYAQASTG